MALVVARSVERADLERQIADVAGRRVRFAWAEAVAGAMVVLGLAVVLAAVVVVAPVVVLAAVVAVVPALCADADTVGRPSANAARADMPNARRVVPLRFFPHCRCPYLTVVMPNLLPVPTARVHGTPRVPGIGRQPRGVGKRALAATWQIGKSRWRFGHCGDGSSTYPSDRTLRMFTESGSFLRR